MAKLTDELMKNMMPLFVESTSPPDHRCGSCSMRIVPFENDIGACTVKEGGISLQRGVCLFWAKGPMSKPDDIHPMRMDDDGAGYIEQIAPVQCGTCKFFDEGNCKLWMGEVEVEQCCISYSRKA